MTTPITTNRFSQNASKFRIGAYTEAEQKMANILSFYGIEYRTQIMFKRDGTNNRGEPLTYTADFVLDHKLILEIEGDGSTSKDNDERDEFFRKLDYTIIHIPNFIALHYAYLIAQFLGLIVGTSKMEMLFK